MTRLVLAAVLAGCGASTTAGTAGASRDDAAKMRAATRMAADRETTFGPVEVGADYQSYRRVTPSPFLSMVHGDRWVDVWVNQRGADAYLDGSPMPVGSIVVKSSWEAAAGAPSAVAGPLYIMEKRPAGYAPEHGDWYFAIHWAEPTPGHRASLGGPIYWRGSSPRVAYCYDCHDSYDRGLGGLTPSSVLPR